MTTLEFKETGDEVALDEEIVALANAASSEMMDACELMYLAATLKCAKLSDGDVVAEIGAFIGTTTVFTHRVLNILGNTGSPVLSIDPFERCPPDAFNPQGVYHQYQENVLKADAGSRCFPLVGFSQDVHMVVPNNLGVLIVDGDHRYEGVRNDLLLYGSKIRVGGFLFADDYSLAAYPGVYHAFNEFMAARPDFRVLHKAWFAIAQRVPLNRPQ